MNTIIYLIVNGNKNYNEKNYDDAYDYYLDAWITLKEYLLDQKIDVIDDIKFDDEEDTKFVKDWLRSFFYDRFSENNKKVALDILNSIYSYFKLNKKDLIMFNREISDLYFELKDYETSDRLYESYIEKYPSVMEYYYGYGLNLFLRKEYVKSLNILEDGISMSKQDTYHDAALEILIEIYEALDEKENALKVKNKLEYLKKLH